MTLSWPKILRRVEYLIGSAVPFSNAKSFLGTDAFTLLKRIKKLSASTDHPFISVLQSSLSDESLNVKETSTVVHSSCKTSENKIPGSVVVLILGDYVSKCQHLVHDIKFLDSAPKLRSLAETYETIYLAILLHKSVVQIETLNPPSVDQAIEWLENMELGNKFAILAGDALLASASMSIASYRIPKVVGLIAAAIADMIRSEFSPFSRWLNSPVSQCQSKGGGWAEDLVAREWLHYVRLREGALLGAFCEAAVLIAASNSDSTLDAIGAAARHFGSNWACLARLVRECQFIKEASDKRSSYFPHLLGFAPGAIVEPTLVDAFVNKNNLPISRRIGYYSEFAGPLRERIKSSLIDLSQNSIPLNKELELLQDAVSQILTDSICACSVD